MTPLPPAYHDRALAHIQRRYGCANPQECLNRGEHTRDYTSYLRQISRAPVRAVYAPGSLEWHMRRKHGGGWGTCTHTTCVEYLAYRERQLGKVDFTNPFRSMYSDGGNVMPPKGRNPKLPSDVTEQWMICREPGGGIYANEPNPKKLYDNRRAAERDAEELGRAQNRRFYLLKVIAYVEPTAPPVPPVRWHYAED